MKKLLHSRMTTPCFPSIIILLLVVTFSLPTINAANATGTLTDIDGNTYQTIIYGNLEWMVENLRVTHFTDGTAIPSRDELTKAPGSTEDFAVYYKYPNNNPTNKTAYGLLYSWNVAYNHDGNPPTSAIPTKLCPEGWRLPTRTDWATLGNGSFSSTDPSTNILTVTNLPASFNIKYAGDFNTGGFTQFGTQARFWSTELMMPGQGYGCKYLYVDATAPTTIMQSNYRNNNCQSIRLVRDVSSTTTATKNSITSKIKLTVDIANNNFSVEGMELKTSLVLYDVTGKQWLSRTVENGDLVSINNLPKGIYVVKVGVETMKLIKK